MSKCLFDLLLDSIFDEEWLGRRGEVLKLMYNKNSETI